MEGPEGKGKRKPETKIRMGRIVATLWRNKGEKGEFFNVTLARIYKDSSGKWQDSGSFGVTDLPLAIKVLDQAHTWVYEHKRDSDPDTSRDSE